MGLAGQLRPAATEEEGKIELYLSALQRSPHGKRPPEAEINDMH